MISFEPKALKITDRYFARLMLDGNVVLQNETVLGSIPILPSCMSILCDRRDLRQHGTRQFQRCQRRAGCRGCWQRVSRLLRPSENGKCCLKCTLDWRDLGIVNRSPRQTISTLMSDITDSRRWKRGTLPISDASTYPVVYHHYRFSARS
jgi:hypothetical protein